MDSRDSSESQDYGHYITIGLHQSGLSLERGPHRFFLSFDGIMVSPTTAHEHPQATLRALGLIGSVRVGPGYLVVIQTQRPVFERGDTTIWNITESLVIPLKYELAKGCFKMDDTLEIVQTEELQNDNTPTGMASLSGQLNKSKDMFFCKLGVYVNDLRSTPSLAFSTKKVTNLLFDYDTESADSDEAINESEISSFKLKRSITIRGLPPKQKESSFAKMFERSKVQRLEELNLRTRISTSMINKIEKQLKHFFSTGDFFYSNELDITKDFKYENGDFTVSNADEPPNSFCFNANISKNLCDTVLTIPIIQGFVNAIDLPLLQGDTEKSGQLLLISKRSTHRAGSRYLRRGIDDNGDVANFVATSQIVIVDQVLEGNSLFAKFDILRGSIPIFFQQNPANLKPVPYLTRPIEKCNSPFQLHFENLTKSFGNVTCVSLVERSKRECLVGKAYEELCAEYGIEFNWFDFHEICKKMKFDNVAQLLDESVYQDPKNHTIQEKLIEAGWVDSIDGLNQSGVFRINCIDCLDRTNLVQKFLSETTLKAQILQRHSLIPKPEFQRQFNHLWADNGDFISRQYASTDALKGDYTRTSKRNYKGLLNDAMLTMSRYYSGYISDYFKQCFIDYVLGHSKEDVFEEFESTLDVLDPNQIMDDLNKQNSQLAIIMEQLEIPDDAMLVGSWSGFASPLQYDELKSKSGELRDVSVFLTNKTIYLVHFDNVALRIVRAIMIPVQDVQQLEYGTYILSTHNSLSTNPRKNIGLKFTMPVKKMPALQLDEHESTSTRFMTLKFPQSMEYGKVKHIINLISKTCHSSTLENKDIMTTKEATMDVMALMEHRLKKLVWG